MDGSICDCAVAPRGSTHDGAVPPAMVQSIETNDGGVIRKSVAAIHAERPFGGQMGFDQTVCENRRLSPGRCAVQFTVRRSPANGRKMSRIAPPRFEVDSGQQSGGDTDLRIAERRPLRGWRGFGRGDDSPGSIVAVGAHDEGSNQRSQNSVTSDDRLAFKNLSLQGTPTHLDSRPHPLTRSQG